VWALQARIAGGDYMGEGSARVADESWRVDSACLTDLGWRRGVVHLLGGFGGVLFFRFWEDHGESREVMERVSYKQEKRMKERRMGSAAKRSPCCVKVD
jgi:hypothetical protein